MKTKWQELTTLFTSRNLRRPLLRLALLCSMFIFSSLFIIRSFSPDVFGGSGDKNSIDNNFGVDCSLVDRYLQGEIEDKPLMEDPKIVMQLFVLQNSKVQNELIYRPLWNCLVPDNIMMIDIIKEEYIRPPADRSVPYNLGLDFKTDFESNHQAMDVNDMVYKNTLRNGVFFEAGAFDCEDSVTLAFEANLNWTGLLVEAVPAFYESCKEKNRKAKMIHTCVGMQEKPHFIDFDTKSAGEFKSENVEGAEMAMAGIAGDQRSDQAVKMQCFPFYTLVKAEGSPTVNLAVLDIEGYELAVLRTIPWDKVDVEVWSIETDLAGKFMAGSREEIIDIMTKAGYARFDHRNDFNKKTGRKQNDMFVRNDIVKKYNVVQL